MSVQLELKPDWARVAFPDAKDGGTRYADYHYFWLRHNCPCLNGCRHPTTKERTIDAAAVPLEIRPLRASTTTTGDGQDAITFVWAPIATKDDSGNLAVLDESEHISTFPVQWLRDNAYGANRTETHPLPPHDAALVTIDYKEFAAKHADSASSTDANTKLTLEGSVLYKAALYDSLSKYGVAVIRNRGSSTEDIIYDFIDASAEVIPTHFGRIEHLRTDNVENANNDQLGYTNAAVRLHTDQCYLDNVPGFQFLHCIRPADVGGDNYFVHAESAANYLKTEVSRRAYDLLTSVPVRFDRKQSKFQALHVSPILRLSDEIDEQTGERKLAQVRYSYFTQAAQNNVPFSELREWYGAQQVWDKLLYRDDFQIKANLESGDVVIYDNMRVLHARNGFTGPRHMAGVYLDTSDLWSHLGQAKEQAAAL
ncbi:Clavaminate synthase-like protein [Martensiomyces pterosporus]|nr:Clavaminate synthase-like protein [Martensiomyces pterosporus]